MEFTISAEAYYLVVRVTGAPSEREARQMLLEMGQRSGAAGLKGALLEVKVAFGLDPVSLFSLVQGLLALGFPSDYRFAILLLDDVASESAHFAETAASNRGWKVRVFRERKAAVEWLAPRAG
jgi:Fe2+ transport system protein FeoA